MAILVDGNPVAPTSDAEFKDGETVLRTILQADVTTVDLSATLGALNLIVVVLNRRMQGIEGNGEEEYINIQSTEPFDLVINGQTNAVKPFQFNDYPTPVNSDIWFEKVV